MGIERAVTRDKGERLTGNEQRTTGDGGAFGTASEGVRWCQMSAGGGRESSGDTPQGGRTV